LANVKPAALKTGDTIGVVAPAGAVRDDQLTAGLAALRSAGFIVEMGDAVGARAGYFAGEKEERAKNLQEFFARADIQAVFCARGGFGSIQLLSLLDPEVIRLHPKLFVGYSDVTILLNWFVQRCGFITFHGPMVSMEIARGLKGRTADFFWQTLMGKKREWRVSGRRVRPGMTEATMVGGCLSVVVTTIGTPYEIETAGKIVFLEDIGEKPYRIERMLTHLRMAGKFDGIAGLVFGHFADCEGNGDRGIAEIIHDLFRDAAYPVLSGFPSGHGEENLLLPFGARMALDGEHGTLSLLECPVD
jgi:muramoyltetrapeptide carboxypeptidase